jgi:hypothetical protein
MVFRSATQRTAIHKHPGTFVGFVKVNSKKKNIHALVQLVSNAYCLAPSRLGVPIGTQHHFIKGIEDGYP